MEKRKIGEQGIEEGSDGKKHMYKIQEDSAPKDLGILNFEETEGLFDESEEVGLLPCEKCKSGGLIAGSDGWFVMCSNKDCEHETPCFKTIDEAIDAWNWRV